MKFNENGYLDPGIHDMSLDEIESSFVAGFPRSKTRPFIISGYKRHAADLSSLGVLFEQFMNGSFISTKNDPGDVDLVCFADANAIDCLPLEMQQRLKALVDGKATRDTHLCDAYFCPTLPETDPAFDETRSARKYWMGEFGFDRLDRPKGIVRTQILPGGPRDDDDD